MGLNDQNAFYCHGQADCGGRNEVQFGKNPSGNWVSTLDVAGHEMGHGIDDYTPSGISRRGTQEFVGDVLGTLTEHYDNQPSPYDTPDYLIGEEANLVGSGEIRNMTNPAAEGHPVCYTTAIDTTQVHAAAGPGDHWFWLLANGGTSRCDSTAVTGIGIQKAGKIFYNAMLLKTTASGYQAYRTWTLQAAKTLHPTSCTEFNAVKLAWDAVNVPVQAGEPTCTGGGPGSLPLPPPGHKTGPPPPPPPSPPRRHLTARRDRAAPPVPPGPRSSRSRSVGAAPRRSSWATRASSPAPRCGPAPPVRSRAAPVARLAAAPGSSGSAATAPPAPRRSTSR